MPSLSHDNKGIQNRMTAWGFVALRHFGLRFRGVGPSAHDPSKLTARLATVPHSHRAARVDRECPFGQPGGAGVYGRLTPDHAERSRAPNGEAANLSTSVGEEDALPDANRPHVPRRPGLGSGQLNSHG